MVSTNIVSAGLDSHRPLRGRARERSLLEAAISGRECRAVIARGMPGIGKSALMRHTLRELAGEGALTGAGKHVEGDHNADLTPVISAIEQAIAAGLDQLYEPEGGLATLGAALGPNVDVFANLGSGLLKGLAANAPITAMPAEAAEERLIQAVLTTLHWLKGFGRPIALLIDDWGRSEERARRLYIRLVSEPDLDPLLILATERPQEPSQLTQHPKVRAIDLKVLDARAVGEVVADMLPGATGAVIASVLDYLEIGEAVPFDVIQALLLLEQVDALARHGAEWRFNPDVANRALGDAPTFTIATRISQLAEADLYLARTLCSYREPLDAAILIEACGCDPAQGRDALDRLALNGIILLNDGLAAIAHDRISEALLASMTEMDRRAIAIRVSEGLRRTFHDSVISLQAMLALRLQAGLDGADSHGWATLFAEGARRARATGDRANGTLFAEAGLELADRAGLVSHDVLTEATLSAVEQGDHDKGRKRADRLAETALDDRQLARADEIRMFAARMAGDMGRALDVGLEASKRAGVSVAEKPTLIDVAVEVLRIRLNSTRKAMDAGPLSDEELTLVAPRLRVLMASGSLLHERNIRQALIHGARSARGRLGSGTALGASVCSFVCAMTGGYKRAAQWAAISDARHSPAQPNRAAAILATTYFGHWFTRPRAELAPRNDEAEALAYAEGDLSSAAYANRNRVLDSLFLGRSLSDMAALADKGLVVAERLNDLSTRPVVAALRQFIENLMVAGPDRWRLSGAYFDIAVLDPAEQASSALVNNVHRPLAMLRALLATVFGEYQEVAAIHSELHWAFRANPHNPQVAIWAFTTGLALYRSGRVPPPMQLRVLRRLARLNPRDNLHRLLLLKAERARLGGRAAAALTVYEKALDAAINSDCRLEEGLVARAAAEGATMLGFRTASNGFALHADAIWRLMNAKTLVSDDLEPLKEDDDSHRLRGQLNGLRAAYEERVFELAAARDSAEMANRANRAKSRLLASVGHELRTPLQGIAGLVEVAAVEDQPPDLNVLSGAIDQLSTVIGDLTDLGALEGGGLSLAAVSFAPRLLVASVCAVHEPSLIGDDRSIVQLFEGAECLVVGDEVRVRQILSNLISNAVKHGAGVITVSLAMTLVGERVSLSIDVSDEGPGLSPADVVRLFEPFERGASVDRIAGLGLGLSISRRLAQAMNGNLTAHTGDRDGAAFRLSLDLPVSCESATEAPTPPRGLRVLLAEDTPLSRQVLATLLRAEHALVEEVEDGEQALALAGRRDFDLLILDMHTPGRNGVEIARQIRAGGRNHETPIAIVTASSSRDIAGNARAVGVQAVLRKPIGRIDLRRLLANATSREWSRMTESSSAATTSADRIAELRAVLGEADTAELLTKVEVGVLAASRRIDEAVKTGNVSLAAREAHQLAGLASHFGLTLVSEAAHSLADELACAAVNTLSPSVLANLHTVVRNTEWSDFIRRA